mmetsp:Transcript_7564/g.22194  ORF Transcript_7564/g.22194 Transcript_7564/m.22194 type:complete len:178 (+) Transcript_7564:96-629(+)
MTSGASEEQRKSQSTAKGSWTEVVGDVYNGVTVGASHSLWFVTNWVKTEAIRPAMGLVGLGGQDDSNEASDEEENPGLKVIGVGYGRTGTVRRKRTVLLVAPLSRCRARRCGKGILSVYLAILESIMLLTCERASVVFVDMDVNCMHIDLFLCQRFNRYIRVFRLGNDQVTCHNLDS